MKKAKLIRYLKYIIVNILIAALISILMIRYVVSAYKIEGSSMNSVLKDRERILIYKLAVKNGNIERFDIVVLRKPGNPGSSIIKRVVGLPGEVIEIKKGDVYIDSKKLPQPFLKKENNFTGIHMNPLLIRRGHYFLIGDNRKFSRDSRYFGEVPGSDILGKATFRYWPLSRLGKIE
ncbi:MAG: signal peptidase I [Candidatus Aminicenantes bacterium]|nr:signal peptidase I [Candidatus Aminicenantes bacterium]